jgi:hypothetical protein
MKVARKHTEYLHPNKGERQNIPSSFQTTRDDRPTCDCREC